MEDIKDMARKEQELVAFLQGLSVSRVISRQTRYNVLKRQKWRCNSCGVRLNYSKEHEWGESLAHIDHIYPFSERWSYENGAENINEESNLQGLCAACNKAKYNRKG